MGTQILVEPNENCEGHYQRSESPNRFNELVVVYRVGSIRLLSSLVFINKDENRNADGGRKEYRQRRNDINSASTCRRTLEAFSG